MLDPPVEILVHPAHEGGGELLALERALVHRSPSLTPRSRARLLADLAGIFVRESHEHADHPCGHDCTELTDHVESVGTDERIESIDAELADVRFETRDLPGREHPRQQSAVDGVGRGVLENHDPRRHLHARLDDLQHAAPTRDECFALLQPTLDVRETTHRVEVMVLVVVERRLFTQALERWVRVGVDLDVVRIPVDVRSR